MASIWQFVTNKASRHSEPGSEPGYEPIYEDDLERSASPLGGRGLKDYFLFPRRKRSIAAFILIDTVIVLTLILCLEPLITLLLRNDDLFRPEFNLGNVTAVPDRSGKHKIPRILHQTTATDIIPDKWIESQRSCKEKYGDYEYKLWTDQGAQNFLAREYPWFLDSFNNYAFPIQRADAIRYFVLYHYGGIYLDMDTFCNQTFPMQEIETGPSEDIALFKSTLPTGITNDFMISSQGHPAFAMMLSKLPAFYSLTRCWAEMQPYVNIMLSSGPLFVSLVVKDYLLQQPSLPSSTVQIIEPAGLDAYISDLESSTWHTGDAKALMWLGTRPWTWFSMGIIGVFAGLSFVNCLLFFIYSALNRRFESSAAISKLAKLA